MEGTVADEATVSARADLGQEWTDRTVGRYRLLDRVGSGAAGIVFRACNADNGDVVALKLVHLRDPRDLECFRREIHCLSRLRIDGIVQIVEQGVAAGFPWYAMELIDGTTIDALWSPARAGRASERSLERLRPALQAIRQLCDTLAVLHGEGIVHRDLKPDNIVLRNHTQPVLVDFGLAARFGARVARETLDTGGEMLGTLAYMSPEQARGEFVDARADLYSVGCILYELVTGAPPYGGAAWQVLDQQLHAVPVPPADIVPSIPPALSELILRLLAKNPADRIGYAVDLAEMIAGVLDEPATARAANLPMYLYRARFSGRRGSLGQLATEIGNLERGQGNLVLVGGESGVGKTRFVMEAARTATLRGAVVVTGECVSLESSTDRSQFQGGPLHPLIPLLRYAGDYCRSAGPEVARRILGRRARTLAVYEESLQSIPGLEDYPALVPMPAAAARDRLVGDLAETLRLLASEMRLVLVLDDLQWADELTIHVLQTLPRSFYREAPLLLLGCFRTEETAGALSRWLDSGDFVSIDLDRLDQNDLAVIVSDMLAVPSPPEELTRFLSEHSEGNPFFVSEYLRMVVEEHRLVHSKLGGWEVARSGSHSYEGLPMPSSVFSLVRTRIDAMSERARELSRLASAIGRQFDSTLLRAASGWADQDQMETVAELVARHVLEEGPGDVLRFTHDKLREVAYEGVPPAERKQIHRSIASAIEACEQANLAHWYPSLALHWSNGGDDFRAARYYSRAGAAALQSGASGDACALLEHALASNERSPRKADPVERSRWLRQLGEASYGVGDIDGVIVHSIEAIESLGFSPARSQLRRAASIAADFRQVLTSGSMQAIPFDAASHEASLAAGQASQGYYLTSQLLGGVASGLQCISLARRSGKPATATQAFAQIGYLCGTANLDRLSRRCFSQARAMRSDADPNLFGGSLYFEAMSELGKGKFERSAALGQEAFTLLDGINNRQEAETALAIVSNALYYLGHYAESAERCATLLDSARARGNSHHTAWGLFLSGRARMAQGDLAEGISQLEDGYAILRTGSDVLSLIMCEGSLCRALLYDGREARALEVRDCLEARLRENPVVALAQCLDGVAALPEVTVDLLRRTGAQPLRASFVWSCRVLSRFAWMFPFGRPASLRLRAELALEKGHPRRAVRLWQRALAEAARCEQAYEIARCEQRLALHARSPDARRIHRQSALERFRELGCSHHVREMLQDDAETHDDHHV